jgi:hypothetical protein
MNMPTSVLVENGLRCVRNAHTAILRLYLDGDPDADPAGWELARVSTPRPPQFAAALDALNAAEGILLNALDSNPE